MELLLLSYYYEQTFIGIILNTHSQENTQFAQMSEKIQTKTVKHSVVEEELWNNLLRVCLSVGLRVPTGGDWTWRGQLSGQ